MTDPNVLQAENAFKLLRTAEKTQRSISSAIETVLSMGDFQKQIDHVIEPQELINLVAEPINEILKFDVSAIYLVDQVTSDFKLSSCIPNEFEFELENQFEHLIEHGYVAWALREPRGIVVYSIDGRYRVVLHSMATYSRIKGIFIGLSPFTSKKIPDASPQVLTLLLRNAANALESLEYIDMFERQKAELHIKVDEKVGELRQRNNHLLNIQKMEAIAILAGGVAHEFNNALFAMLGNLELLDLGITDHREFEKVVDRLHEIVKKMADLTMKLLAYARGGKYMPQTVSMNTIVEGILEVLEKEFRDGIDLVLDLSSEDCFVRVDVTQMQLTVSAIVTNAIEALEEDGRIFIKVERVTIKQTTEETMQELTPGDHVLLHISDNGRGMDDSTRKRIFEPFFSTKFQGRGLGLAAAYGIVKNHHGSISVESELGKGTTVRIYLPSVS
jgi:signal transduction histidine kinase